LALLLLFVGGDNSTVLKGLRKEEEKTTEKGGDEY
jgi:hypothetical protein